MVQKMMAKLKEAFSPEDTITEIKWYQMMDLWLQCTDMPLKQYFDIQSGMT